MLRSDRSNFVRKSITKSFDNYFKFLDKSVYRNSAISKVIGQLQLSVVNVLIYLRWQ